MDDSLSTYVQPIASHGQYPERLLVRDEAGRMHLWPGNGDAMVEITPELAIWMVNRPEISAVPGPRHWFDVETLPVTVETYDSEWSVAD